MKHTILTLLILLGLFISGALFSQTSGIVIDKETEKPIPYANIWIADGNIGTTSDMDGNFTLPDDFRNKSLIISAIGYERLRFQIDSLYIEVALIPKTYQISEAKVMPKKNKEVVIDKLRRSQVGQCQGPGFFPDSIESHSPNGPVIYAKKFQYKTDDGSPLFLKSIKFATFSKIKSTTNLRILSVNKNGEPGDDILKSNFLVEIKKGKKVTRIDIPDSLIIQLPDPVLFIALECLVTKENEYLFIRHFIDEHGNRSSNKVKAIAYMLWICSINTNSEMNCWNYVGGNWVNQSLRIIPVKTKNVRNEKLAVELTLIY